jgi:hypothetical protein
LATSTREDGLHPPGSVSLSKTPGASAQSTFDVIDPPEPTPPSQTPGISAQTTAFAALIPPKRCEFANNPLYLGKPSSRQRVHVNPKLRFDLEGQEYEINMANKNEPINSCPKRMDSGKSNKPLMQGIGPVSRVFCHREIDKSIIQKLSREVDVTILESNKWVKEMSEYL